MLKPKPSALQVFLGYSQKDEPLKVAFLEHLSIFEHLENIDVWTEDRIRPGQKFQREIEAALRRADIALLLISASFLASELAKTSSLLTLIQESADNRAVFVPVLARPCAWAQHPMLVGISPLPRSGTPLTQFQGRRRDEVLVDVCRDIAALADAVRATRADAQTELTMRFTAGVASAPSHESHGGEEDENDDDDRSGAEPTAQPVSLSSLHEFTRKVKSITEVKIAVLQSDKASDVGRTFVLPRSPTHLGRAADADVQLRDPNVSRKHAKVELVDGRVVICDTGSSHGTSVNGQAIGAKLSASSIGREVVLHDHDIVQLGPTTKLSVSIPPESD